MVFRGENPVSPLRLNFSEREVLLMFVGTYEHNMDSKNRVFVPAKFREELGDSFYYKLYASKECPSIQLYSKDEFRRKFEEPARASLNQAESKILYGKIYMGVDEANVDNQGRISIGSVIARKAGLEKCCIFVGFGSYVELMSPDSYDKYLDKMCESNSEDEAALAAEEAVYRRLRSEGKLLGLEGEEG